DERSARSRKLSRPSALGAGGGAGWPGRPAGGPAAAWPRAGRLALGQHRLVRGVVGLRRLVTLAGGGGDGGDRAGRGPPLLGLGGRLGRIRLGRGGLGGGGLP